MITEEQNQPLQQHNVNGCPGDSETIEILRKKVADQQRLIHEKEQRLTDCAEEYRQMCREMGTLIERYNSSKWKFSDKQSDLPF